MALLDFTYPELSFEALNTPVDDWRTLFCYMNQRGLKTLFDAGAGNALSAQVAQKEFPNIRVHAWEIMAKRLEGVHCPDHDVRVADLFHDPIPKADVHFLYLPTGPLLECILSQLEEGALIAAVESHGELFPRLDESAELIDELEMLATRHTSKMRIYRWQNQPHDLKFKLRQESYQNTFKQVLINEHDPFEGQCQWLADCFGLTVTPDEHVETLYPPRRFKLEQVVNTVEFDQHEILKERRTGKWRKIFIKPRLLAETPEGVRIEFNGTKSSF